MSSVTTQKSDRQQTLTAVLFMSLFAAVFLLFVTTKDRIMAFVCSDEAISRICPNQLSPDTAPIQDQLIKSQIISACVDIGGLKISVAFDTPLAGESSIQVFTTGEDVFPGEQGMEDSFRTSMEIPATTDQLDFVIPVETMPEGEHIFGNIITSQENVISSHVAYFVAVTGCLSTDGSISNPTLITSNDNIPTNFKATCLSDDRLMLAFEFDKPVLGQYQALVAGMPYQLASVGNQPVALFFSGDVSPKGPIVIKLVSAVDQDVLLEETFNPPTCHVE